MKRQLFIALWLFCCVISVAAQDKNKVKVEDDQTYLVLSTKRIQTMEAELDEVATKGFRVLYGAPTQQYDMAILLRRVPEAKSDPYKYKILATSRVKTMEKELNQLGTEGYQLLSRTITFKMGFFTAELLMVMERAPGPAKKYEYELVEANKETKLHKKMDEQQARGFMPVTMITLGNHVVVMEKETSSQ